MADLEQRLVEHLKSSHSFQSELRAGGMSRVFVAEDLALQRKVVIKVLNPTLAATVSIQRFHREIAVVAKLNHPNVVPVLSAGEFDGLPYFIMPYIEGESLRGRIARGPLSLRETVGILKDVMRALAYAHSAGIVHRDIKPDNILLAGSAALVTDFGVAKAVSAARDRGSSAGQSITGVGISLGTPQYMAPEQAAADPDADARVDFYALGIVAYEMLVGSPPFHGRTPQALLAAQLTELPPPLASRRYDVPVALSNLVMQCLEKDPADRPRNASEIVSVLESADALSGPVAATPEARARRRWKMLSTAFSVLLAVSFLGGLVVWSLWPDATAAPAAATARVVSPQRTVRVTPVVPIGPESAALATAMSAAIESALVRDGAVLATRAAAPGDSASIVVETTVQRAGPRARALIRVLGGDATAAVWADQLDFRVDDAFAAQDSLGARVVRAVREARARL